MKNEVYDREYINMKPVAIIYDFDGTLANSNMQESSFIPALGMDKKEFWDMAKERAETHNMDSVLAYMTLMLDKVKEKQLSISKKALKEHGNANDKKLFHGVKTWFGQLNDAVHNMCPGVQVKHYIISAGIKEMIEGSCIAKEFDYIFASSFMYDKNGQAIYPALSVNYTGKTQFLYRINKGVNDVHNDHDVNRYTPKNERPIPFEHMIYIGDGDTDIPAMKMVRDKGGFSIAVYGNKQKRHDAEKMFVHGRVDFVCEADYGKDKILMDTVLLQIHKLYIQHRLNEKIDTLKIES
jgi:phosphoserine phosphatase